MLKAVIIDDEPDCVRLLALQLKMYCPTVEVSAACTDSEEGLARITELMPDIVFLDIEMPLMNGFELLEKLGDIRFSLIFVTAYDQFAVKAFRFSALDYLLKPISGKDLTVAVSKAESRSWPTGQQVHFLKQQLQSDKKILPDKFALPFQNGVSFVEIRKIIYCESENNYTHFYLIEGQRHTVAKTLGDISEVLEDGEFLRVHRRYLVSLDHIKKYVRGEGNYLVLSNGQNIPVARNQKEKLIEKFGWF